MNCDEFELPTRRGIEEAGRRFDNDAENKVIEPAIRDLFGRYPKNTDEAQVLLKVVTLNQLYSTRLPTRDSERPNVFDLAGRIPTLKLDDALKKCDLEIVNTISTTQFPGKKKVRRFAFATKYAHWHRPDCYAIWDRNVQRYFSCLRKHQPSDWQAFSDGFRLNGEWGYPEFHGLMVRFRSVYRLDGVSFKDLDKFLWLHGDPPKQS